MNLGTDSLLAKLDRLPPIMCRLLAKHNGSLITDVELMRRTGWGKRRLRWVYKRMSWRRISVEEVDAFLSACGFKWTTQRRQRWLLQLASNRDDLTKMRHLRGSSFSDVQRIKRLISQLERLLK